MLLVGAVAVPLLALSGVSFWQLAQTERAQAEERLVNQVRGAARLVESEYARARTLLVTLAGSSAAARGDDAAVRRELDAASAGFGRASLARLGPAEAARGCPAVSDLLGQPEDPAVALCLLAPDGGALLVRLPAEALAAVLERQPLAPGCCLTLLDGAGRRVARVPARAEAAGKPVPAALQTRLREADAGLVHGVPTPEGQPAVHAVAHVPGTGHAVILSVPENELDEPVWRALWRTLGVGAAFATLGLGLAAWQARRLALDLRRLRFGAASTAGPRPALREVAELAASLAAARAEADRAHAALRAMFEASPVGIAQADGKGLLLDANDAFLRLVGAGRAALEAGALRWDALTPAEWREADMAALARLNQTGTTPAYERAMLRPDGTRVPVLVSAARLGTDPFRACAFVVDLSDRVQARTALAEAAERLQLALEGGRLGTYDHDLRTGRNVWSDRMRRLFGLGPGDPMPVGPMWLDHVHPEDRERVLDTMRQAAARGGPYELEYRTRSADGVERVVSVRGHILHEPWTGEAVRSVGVVQDVTAQRAVEAGARLRAAELAEAHERLQLALDAGRLGTWEVCSRTGHATWDARTRALWGLAPGDPVPVEAEIWREAIHPDDHDRIVRAYRALLDEGVPYDVECRVRPPGGPNRIVAVRGHLLRDDAGEAVRAIGVVQDVTERREAEAQLVEGAAQLRLALDGGRLGTWEMNLRTWRQRWSDRVKAFYGFAPEDREPTLEQFAELVPDQDFDRVVAAVDGARRDGERFGIEHRVLARDGVERTLSMHGVVLRDPRTGEAVRALGVSRDVTAERAAERALRESLAEMNALYDTAPVGLCVLDRDLRFVRINERLAEFNGPPAQAHLGRTLREVLPGLADEAERMAARVLAGETLLDVELAGEGASDGRCFMENWVPRRGADGEITGISVVVLEVTAQRAAEAALKRLNEALEARVAQEVAAREAAQALAARAQKLQALGQLAAGVAHDFNNVLQTVGAGLAGIQDAAEDAERVRRLAALASGAVERGTAITGRLLVFARHGGLRAGPVAPAEAPPAVDVAPLLRGLREVLAPALGRAVRLEVEADESLPPVRADAAQLETVLVNLAANARDAIVEAGRDGATASASDGMPARGGGLIRLRARAEPPGSGALADRPSVRLDVQDDGAGMDEDTLARAAEPFFTTKPPGRGTGLGLSLARGFADESGGRLEIRSAPGQGTTVSLWLPRAEAEASSPPVPEAVPRAGRLGRVLVVDDDALVREVMSDELRRHGHEVAEHESGAAVLAHLDRDPAWDLLVSDLSMPGMDGLALIRAARVRRPGLHALLLTGYAGDRALYEALDAGEAALEGVVLVGKPVTGRNLAARVGEALGPVPALLPPPAGR